MKYQMLSYQTIVLMMHAVLPDFELFAACDAKYDDPSSDDEYGVVRLLGEPYLPRRLAISNVQFLIYVYL